MACNFGIYLLLLIHWRRVWLHKQQLEGGEVLKHTELMSSSSAVKCLRIPFAQWWLAACLCSACLHLSFACWLAYIAVRFIYVLALSRWIWSYKVYFVGTHFSDKILPVLIGNRGKKKMVKLPEQKLANFWNTFIFIFYFYYIVICAATGMGTFYFIVYTFVLKHLIEEILQTVLIRYCPRGHWK